MDNPDWNPLQFSDVESEPEFIFETKKSKIYKNSQTFVDSWLKEEQFSGWLEKVENNPQKANCNVCKKLIRAKHHNLKMHKETKEHKMRAERTDFVDVASTSFKQSFVDKWLEEDEFKGWLQKCDDIFKARCKFCCCFIKTKRHNLICHSKSENHKKKVFRNSEELIEEENVLEEMEVIYLDEGHSQDSVESADESDESEDEGSSLLKILEKSDEEHSQSSIASADDSDESSSSLENSERPKKYSQNFREEWLDCPKYKDWLQEDENNSGKCICKICNKTLGAKKSNLESHLLSKNHLKLFQTYKNKEIKKKEIKKLEGTKYYQKFCDKWLELKQFKNWLKRIDDDPTSAFCSVCNQRLRAKKFNLEDHCRRAHHKRMIKHSNSEILPSYSKPDKNSKYVFCKKWLNEDDFSGWLIKDEKDPGMVICTICKRQLTATKSNLKVHSKSRSHIWRLEQENSLKGFFSNFTGS